MPGPVPSAGGRSYVTDGGLETDLIFNHGLELAEFAAFPLIQDDHGRSILTDYYAAYADIARSADVGLVLATPTWRANPDWARLLGYDESATAAVNRDAVTFLTTLREKWSGLDDVIVSGVVGPRGDGYVPGEQRSIEEAADYHRGQVESFAAAGADLVEALTMTTADEAAGVVCAANAAGLPVGILFTVEVDGTLPDRTPLGDAISRVEESGDVAFFGVNCAHPLHLARSFADGTASADSGAIERIAEVRPNASTMSHVELDAMTELDAGDLDLLVSSFDQLRPALPGLCIIGGCCGTDARHVAAMWGVGR